MDPITPITFHKGKQHHINGKDHFKQAGDFSDKRSIDTRYCLYERYCGVITDYYDKLRTGIIETSVKAVIDFLRLQCGDQTSKDIVGLAAVMFLDTATPAICDFFDSLSDANTVDDFRIVRLKTGGAYANVEQVIDDILKQFPECVGSTGGFESLLHYWKRQVTDADQKKLLIVLDDILSFGARVLEDFLFILAQYKSFGLPITVAVGLPGSTSLDSSFPTSLVRNYSFEKFTISTSSVLKKLLQFVSFPAEMPQLSPRVFKLLTFTALENGMTCEEVVNALKLIILEHFRSKAGSVYCLSSKDLKSKFAAPPMVRPRSAKTQPAQRADEYRWEYWIGTRVFQALATTASEYSAWRTLDLVDVICASADDNFFESEQFEQVLSIVPGLETEKVIGFIDECQYFERDYDGCTSEILKKFKKDCRQFKEDFDHLDELQEEENQKQRNADADDTGGTKRSKAMPVNPNRSKKLSNVLEGISTQIATQQIDVAAKTKRRLQNTLKRFFMDVLVPPLDDAVATMYFDDLDFLRQILSPSSRNILAGAMSNPEYGMRYDIFEDGGPNIDLGKWFKEFKAAQEELDEEKQAAKFYKMLSALEFVGFITKGQKKGCVKKLCWTTATV